MIMSNGTEISFEYLDDGEIILEIRDLDEHGTWIMQPMKKEEGRRLLNELMQALTEDDDD